MADTHHKLKEGSFFFIVGDPKTPYRKIGNGFVNLSTGKLEHFPPSSEEPLKVRKVFELDLQKKYGMSRVQLDAWLEKISKKLS